ncbi:MAG TPA: YihY/virulence factor BrkB family protein [Chloroflexota bacterium]|nr:YihY/virulence factor BrkB family protein [Chloroflexota bacterium]
MQAFSLLKDPRALFGVLKETYSEWSEDKAARLAAALAYYTAFSIAPLLLIAISVAGLVFGREAAEGQVVAQLQGLLGPEAAETLQTSIAQSQDTGASTLSAIVGIAMLVWSASNVFSQLQDALNTIWEVAPDPNAGMVATVKRRFLSMTMVLGIGFLLLVSLVLTAAVSAVGNLLAGFLPGGELLWQGVNFLLGFAVVALLFAAIYKVLPDAEVEWSDVWVGAVVTSFLFTVGRILIGLYLGHASVGSTFGAAGSLLVFLVWVYYSAQILFFGAEFTQVYAQKYGSRIKPSEGAVGVTEETRAEQGIPSQETLQQSSAEKAGRAPVAAAVASNSQANGSVVRAPVNGRATDNGHANGVAHAAARPGKQGQNAGQKRPRGSGGTKGAPDAVKKLMWTGLVTGSIAGGAIVARRASAEIWRGIFHEDPPTKNV